MKYALLVGVSKYFDQAVFPAISSCKKDVTGVYNHVIDPSIMGYMPKDVMMMHNEVKEPFYLPLEKQIEWALKDISARCKKDDVFLFYFSGHGCIKNEKAYLVAQDTYWDSLGGKNLGLSFDKISNILSKSKAAKKISIFDCCHCGESLTKAKNFLFDSQFHQKLNQQMQQMGSKWGQTPAIDFLFFSSD